MKRLIFLWTFLCIFSLKGSAISKDSIKLEDYYFCSEPGMRLEFVRTLSNGKIKWTNIMTIQKVTFDGQEGSIEYLSEMLNEKGKPKYRKPVPMSVSLNQEGIVMDLGKSASDMLKELLPEFMTRKIKYNGGVSLFPSQMQVGDTLENVACVITILGIDGTMTMDERKVLGFERLSTPVGEFDCVSISEHKIERGTPRNRETIGISWYAKGYGIIRHDTYDMKGKRLSVEVLNRMEKIIKHETYENKDQSTD